MILGASEGLSPFPPRSPGCCVIHVMVVMAERTWAGAPAPGASTWPGCSLSARRLPARAPGAQFTRSKEILQVALVILCLGLVPADIWTENPVFESQYMNSMDRGAWQATLLSIAESDTTETI